MNKKIAALLMSISPIIMCQPEPAIRSIMLSSGLKQPGISKPEMANVAIDFQDGERLEATGYLLSTENNKVGIRTDVETTIAVEVVKLAPNPATQIKLKAALSIPASTPLSNYIVLSFDQATSMPRRLFINVGDTMGAATGTPAYLMWQNIIGTRYHGVTAEDKKRMGAARRTDFCNGEPLRMPAEQHDIMIYRGLCECAGG